MSVKIVSIGSKEYRLVATQRGGGWVAHAEDAAGVRFGIECAGSTAPEAIDRLTRWLEWQQEHASALVALEDAERSYHRTIAGSAFASPTEGPTPVELQKESLEQVEAARTRLDEIRARRPD